MRNRKCRFLMMPLVALVLQGCLAKIPTDEYDDSRVYDEGDAYGVHWRYMFSGKRVNYFTVDSDAFSYKNAQTVIEGGGTRIVLADAIYVLRRDGSFKHVEFDEPVQGVSTYWVKGKMYIVVSSWFMHLVETDCKVYPRKVSQLGGPDLFNDTVGYFFGEYDVDKKAFYLKQFHPLLNDLETGVSRALDIIGPRNYQPYLPPLEEFALPLICDPNVDKATLEQQHQALEAKVDAFIEKLKAEEQAAANSP